MNMLSTKSVLITGANRGIGLEIVQQLLDLPVAPDFIFATCRRPSQSVELQRIASNNPNVYILPLDIRNHDSYRKLVQKVRTTLGPNQGLNMLINNAGIGLRENSDFTSVSADNMRMAFEVNALAPLMLSQAFYPLLKMAADNNEEHDINGNKDEYYMGCDRAAIINISSKKGSHADNEKCKTSLGSDNKGNNLGDIGGGRYPYRTSKATLNMITSNMAIDLHSSGILVAALHPGWVRTSLGGPKAPLSTFTSVAGLMDTIASLDQYSTGGFFDFKGDCVQW